MRIGLYGMPTSGKTFILDKIDCIDVVVGRSLVVIMLIIAAVTGCEGQRQKRYGQQTADGQQFHGRFIRKDKR